MDAATPFRCDRRGEVVTLRRCLGHQVRELTEAPGASPACRRCPLGAGVAAALGVRFGAPATGAVS